VNRALEQQAVFNQLSCGLGRRDEEPNRQLGQRIAADRDTGAVAILVQLLDDPEASSSAIKALYECGYVDAQLLVPHLDAFVALLDSKKNRLVWGSMIGIACIADASPDQVWSIRKDVIAAFESGTTITQDASVLALSRVAESSPQRSSALSDWFVGVMRSCRPKELASWAEKLVPPMGPTWRKRACEVLQSRLVDLPTDTARKRVRKLLDSYCD
jgi:hypothetical protein